MDKFAPKIQILNGGTKFNQYNRGSEYIHVSKSMITFTLDHFETIKAELETYILVGKVGNRLYVAKRPSGMFGGHKSNCSKGSKRIHVQVKADKYGLKEGHYQLIGNPIPQVTKGEQNQDITVTWYELERVN